MRRQAQIAGDLPAWRAGRGPVRSTQPDVERSPCNLRWRYARAREHEKCLIWVERCRNSNKYLVQSKWAHFAKHSNKRSPRSTLPEARPPARAGCTLPSSLPPARHAKGQVHALGRASAPPPPPPPRRLVAAGPSLMRKRVAVCRLPQVTSCWYADAHNDPGTHARARPWRAPRSHPLASSRAPPTRHN